MGRGGWLRGYYEVRGEGGERLAEQGLRRLCQCFLSQGVREGITYRYAMHLKI